MRHAWKNALLAEAKHWVSSIRLQGRAHAWANAVATVERLRGKWDVWPECFVYNVLIGACAVAAQWQCALFSLKLCHERPETSVDEVTYSIAVSTCRASRDWVRACALLHDTRRHRISCNMFVVAAVLSTCEKAAEWKSALDILCTVYIRSAQPDVVVYNSAASIYVKSRRWEEAVQTIRFMERAAVLPNAITYTTMASVCDKALQWYRALELGTCMASRGLHASVVSYNVAVASCTIGDRWLCVLQLLSQMSASHVQVNEILFNSAIRACGQSWTTSLALLDGLWRFGGEADVVTYGASAAASGHSQSWRSGVEILATMSRRGVSPNIVVANAVIDACTNQRMWGTAGQILNQMQGSTIQPSVVTLCCRLEGIEAAGDITNTFGPIFAMKDSLVRLLTSMAKEKSLATRSSVRIADTRDVEEDTRMIVLGIDQLDQVDRAGSWMGLAFSRCVCGLVVNRLLCLTYNAPPDGQRHDEILARQFGLGRVGTVHALISLGCAAERCDTCDHSAALWKNLAIYNSRCCAVHTSLGTDSTLTPASISQATYTEAAAQFVVSWLASALTVRTPAAVSLRARASINRSVRSRGRMIGSGDFEQSEIIVPVSVRHDRSPHAERQALLSLLHSTISVADVRSAPAKIP